MNPISRWKQRREAAQATYDLRGIRSRLAAGMYESITVVAPFQPPANGEPMTVRCRGYHRGGRTEDFTGTARVEIFGARCELRLPGFDYVIETPLPIPRRGLMILTEHV